MLSCDGALAWRCCKAVGRAAAQVSGSPLEAVNVLWVRRWSGPMSARCTWHANTLMSAHSRVWARNSGSPSRFQTQMSMWLPQRTLAARLPASCPSCRCALAAPCTPGSSSSMSRPSPCTITPRAGLSAAHGASTTARAVRGHQNLLRSAAALSTPTFSQPCLPFN